MRPSLEGFDNLEIKKPCSATPCGGGEADNSVQKKTPLFLIFITVFIDLLGFGILIPILPTFSTKVLHLNESQIGITIALYSLVQLFFNPVMGKMSDKFGRKPLIIISLFLNAVGYIIFAFSTSFPLLLLSRIVGGIGGSSIGVAQAYIADVTDKENRSKGMGLIGAAFGLGFVFGPMLGGLLANLGYWVTGFASAAFSISAFIVCIFLLPESHHNRTRETKLGKMILDLDALKNIFKKPDLAVLILIYFLITFSMANIYGTFSLLGYKVFHFSDAQNGYMFGAMGIVSAGVQGGLLRFLAKRLKDDYLILIGAFFMSAGLALMPYGGNFTGLMLFTGIMSVGGGILQPTVLSLVSRFAPENEQGVILGINQSFSAFARVLGPLWGGFVFEYLGPQFPFLTGALCIFIILLTGIIYIPKRLNLEHGNV
jgi:multidrug resistance protein